MCVSEERAFQNPGSIDTGCLSCDLTSLLFIEFDDVLDVKMILAKINHTDLSAYLS